MTIMKPRLMSLPNLSQTPAILARSQAQTLALSRRLLAILLQLTR